MKAIKTLLCLLLIVASAAFGNEVEKIESLVLEGMQKGKIPGLAIVVLKEGQVILKKGYGFASLEKQIPVTSETLFELGSVTKAITGLAVLHLIQEGKINLNAPISDYLPWFHSFYHGQEASIRVGDCLSHTSGLPFCTIASLQPSSGDKALEDAIKGINGLNLDTLPSTHFQYASMNYDILGLLIEVVSGHAYEEYIDKEIFPLLGLTQSLMHRGITAQTPKMAEGYKISHLKPRPYQAPEYRGNAPAGYMISNANDIEKWLFQQLQPSEKLKQLVAYSQTPDPFTTNTNNDSLYAVGWHVWKSPQGPILVHPGNNPNFSSYISFSPHQKTGVAVLTNMNSGYALGIGMNIILTLLGIHSENTDSDFLQEVDFYSILVIYVSIPILCYLLYSLSKCIFQTRRGMRSFSPRVLPMGIAFIFMGLLSYVLYIIPSLFRLNWHVVSVWGPSTLPIALIMIYSVIALSVVLKWYQLTFPKRGTCLQIHYSQS